jgi:hypothetical protein
VDHSITLAELLFLGAWLSAPAFLLGVLVQTLLLRRRRVPVSWARVAVVLAVTLAVSFGLMLGMWLVASHLGGVAGAVASAGRGPFWPALLAIALVVPLTTWRATSSATRAG